MRFAGHGNDEQAGGGSRDINAAVAEGDAGRAVAAGRFLLCFRIVARGFRQEGMAERFRGGAIRDVQREEAVECVDGEDVVAADADGPEVVAKMVQLREFEDGKRLGRMRIGDVDEFDAVAVAETFGRFGAAVFKGMVAGGGDTKVAGEIETIAESVKFRSGNDLRFQWIGHIRNGDVSGSPIAHERVMILHEDGLCLLRADSGNMARMERIGDVEQLDAIDAMGDEADVTADGDACGEFRGIETRQYGGIFSVMDIDDPQAEVAGRQEEIIAVADHLAAALETCHDSYKTGLQRVVFDIIDGEPSVGGRVEIVACTDHGDGSDGFFHVLQREDGPVEICIMGSDGG